MTAWQLMVILVTALITGLIGKRVGRGMRTCSRRSDNSRTLPAITWAGT